MLRSACLCLALIACVTPYQSMGTRGGYSDVQVGENVFRITFVGNGYTAADRASDYALLRSAELTLEKGFRYFVVSSDASATTVSGGGGMSFSAPTVIETVVCYQEKPADSTALVYDAQSVRKALHAKYNEPEKAKAAPSRPPRQVCISGSECIDSGTCIDGLCRYL